MPPSAAPDITASTDSIDAVAKLEAEVAKLKADIASLEGKVTARSIETSARDGTIFNLEAEVAELKALNTGLEEKITSREDRISSLIIVNDTLKAQVAAGEKLAHAQEAVLEGLKNVDPAESHSLRAQLSEAQMAVADEKMRRNRLLRLCEHLSLPIPEMSKNAEDYADCEFEKTFTEAFQRLVEAASSSLVCQQQRDLTVEKRARKEAERLVDCMRLLSGASNIELTADGARYAVTIAKPNSERKVSFSVAWDENYMDYEPLDVCIPDGCGPTYLKDKFDFRLNQAPKFFSGVLKAVFDDSKN